MDAITRRQQLSMEIMQNCRTELYDYFPYLDGAFASIACKRDEEEKQIRTDGDVFFFSEDFIIQEYAKEPQRVTRGMLHMLLHCLYLHPWTEMEQDRPLFHLACDIAVETMIEREKIDGLRLQLDPLRDEVFHFLSNRKVSAQDIFRMLMAEEVPGETDALKAAFCFDDHTSWAEQEEGSAGEKRHKWTHIAAFSSDRKSKSATYGSQAGEDTEVLDEWSKSRYDYRRFLKQFSVLREEVELDLESFDYIFYHLGLENYKDMPLIEPLEYKEVNRLEELVIAIDTSSSCSTEVVQQFLTETYQMLSQKENFFRRMKVYLIQCDTHIEDVVVIHSEEEWKKYSSRITIVGRGGTDFRPVFRYVEELQKKKEIRNLKGLIYFTDGDGIFPKEKTSYETAFVFLKEKAKLDYVPDWAQVLLI